MGFAQCQRVMSRFCANPKRREANLELDAPLSGFRTLAKVSKSSKAEFRGHAIAGIPQLWTCRF